MAEEKKRPEGSPERPKEVLSEANVRSEGKEEVAAKPTTPEQGEAKVKAKAEVELSKKSQEIMKTIEGMTVLELSGLVKALEEKFGVSAAAPMVMGAMAPAAGVAAEAEEKATFTAVLAKVGDKKIQVIKEIRTFTNLGLKEAKDLVESSPVPVKEGVSKEEAEEIKKKLEAVGAAVEIK